MPNRADLGTHLAELGALGRNGQVAQGRQHIATANREALDSRNHGLGHIANHGMQFLDRQADRAAAIVAPLVGGLIASASEHDHADRPVPAGAVEGVDQLITGPPPEGIVFLLAIDRYGGDAIYGPIANVRVFHGLLLLACRPVSRALSGRPRH